jgi:hypothetical protein
MQNAFALKEIIKKQLMIPRSSAVLRILNYGTRIYLLRILLFSKSQQVSIHINPNGSCSRLGKAWTKWTEGLGADLRWNFFKHLNRLVFSNKSWTSFKEISLQVHQGYHVH